MLGSIVACVLALAGSTPAEAGTVADEYRALKGAAGRDAAAQVRLAL